MTRTAATNRLNLGGSYSKNVVDTFAADGWTKSGSGTTGTWSVDAVDTYSGRSTLKLVTAGTGTGSNDYAIKALSSPIRMDGNGNIVFELIAKVNDINKIGRFYLDLYGNANYYSITLESTGNKWGFNNEYEIFRGTIHMALSSLLASAYIKQVRLRVSDTGTPITVNYAELSYYKIPKKAYLVFTNDDGNASAYDFMHTVMKPLGLVGTFFPSSENVASGQGGNALYMTHANVLQLEADGFEVGIHGEKGTVTKTATTISFDAASKEIRDSGNGLLTAGFLSGQFVTVSGTTKNNGKYTIVSAAAGVLVVSETVTDEVAGSSFTLSASGFSAYTNATSLKAYIQGQIDYFRDTVGVASNLKSMAYPGGEYGKDSSSFPYTVAQSLFDICRTTHVKSTESNLKRDNHRIHGGIYMYLSSVTSVDNALASISQLISSGGIGVMISHTFTAGASDTLNYNLTDATTVMNFIAARVAAGQLEVITFGDIPSKQFLAS